MVESKSWQALVEGFNEGINNLEKLKQLEFWIKSMLPKIEEVNFLFYWTTYNLADDLDEEEKENLRVLETAILWKRRIFLFSVYSKRKEFSAYSLNKIDSIVQEINDDGITTTFFTPETQFYLKDAPNGEALIEFTKQILDIWEV